MARDSTHLSLWDSIRCADVWFNSLPDELQSFLQAVGLTRSYTAGQRLFGRGDEFDGIYVVAKGAVRISWHAEGGQEALLVLLQAPQWFGEIALVDGGPRTHDAWADCDATVIRIPQFELDPLLTQHPEYWHHFARLLTQKLRNVFVQTEYSYLLPAVQRIARRLVDMTAGYGAWKDRTGNLVTVSQEQLGLMLQLTRQTVNESLKELERAGLIFRTRGLIELLDVEKLRNYDR